MSRKNRKVTLRFRAVSSLGLALTLVGITAGCARVPEAMRARDYFGEDIDFSFVTGNLLAAKTEPDESGYFDVGFETAFPIGPAALVTAGHAFMTPPGRVGDRFLGYGQGPPPERGETAEFTDDPNCPWNKGCVVRLLRPDQDRGDFALIQLDRALPQWDRWADPTYRPRPGDVVVVGSRRGRDDDRVLTISDHPLPDCRCTRRLRALLPENYIMAQPALAKGWSGSPVKAWRPPRIGGHEPGKWVTFGYFVGGGAHFDSLTAVYSYSVILPVPDDILRSADLPPGRGGAEHDPITASQRAEP